MANTDRYNSLLSRYESLSEEISKKEEELIKLNTELLALSRAASFREELNKEKNNGA